MRALPICLMSGASIAALLLGYQVAQAGGLPSGGRYVSGKGEIGKAAQSTTVRQSSTTGIIDWNSFSIGANRSVTFDNGNGATLNRVVGGNLSTIAGSLHATGSLYLLNAQGVVVSGTGRVVTGGSLVVSTGSLTDTAFNHDHRGIVTAKAAIVNRGSIVSGKAAKLIGGSVRNLGHIQGMSVSVIAKHGDIVAGGTISATGSRKKAAKLRIIADDGTVSVRGTLRAARLNGEGTIETSGRHVVVAGDVFAGAGGTWLIDPKNLTVTAAAAKTIDASLDKGTNVTLETTASSTSGPGTSSSGLGDIVISSALNWTTTAKLTLDAYHGVTVDAEVENTGKGGVVIDTANGGSLSFANEGRIAFTSTSSSLSINSDAYKLVDSVSALASAVAANPDGYFAFADNYTSTKTYTSSPISTEFVGTFEGLGNTITGLKIDDDTAGADLGLFANSAGTLRDIVLTKVSISGGDAADVGGLVGVNDGSVLQSSVSGAVSDDGDSASVGGVVGFGFGAISLSQSSATVSDSGTLGNVGGLIGWAYHAAISNSSTTGKVDGSDQSNIGGLAGQLFGGTITASTSSAASGVRATTVGYASSIGGLVGLADYGTIKSSSTSGTVAGGSNSTAVGGLAGTNDGTIDASFASGKSFSGESQSVGDLVGVNAGTVDASYASGAVSGATAFYVGGLVGNNTGVIEASHATGKITTSSGEGSAGGLLGFNDGTVKTSYATGEVVGAATYVGGLAGFNESLIETSYATGAVSGSAGMAGGLVGINYNGGTIETSYATGATSGTGGVFVGGLVGSSSSVIANSYATGAVTGGDGAYVGGLVGRILDGTQQTTISDSYATGTVTGGTSASIGGLVGEDETSVSGITNSYWDTTTSGITASSQGAGNVSHDPGITARTTAQLQAKLPAGFSSSVWAVSSGVNGGLPYLVALKASY